MKLTFSLPGFVIGAIPFSVNILIPLKKSKKEIKKDTVNQKGETDKKNKPSSK